jgi:hypothetical protein
MRASSASNSDTFAMPYQPSFASTTTRAKPPSPNANARMRSMFGNLCDSTYYSSASLNSAPLPLAFIDTAISDPSAVAQASSAAHEGAASMVGCVCRYADGSSRPTLICTKGIDFIQPTNGRDGENIGKVCFLAVVDLTLPTKDQDIEKLSHLIKSLP